MKAIHDYKGNDLFTETEQLVLEYVEELTLERKTNPEMQSWLKVQFDDTERVELALIGGLWNMTNRLFNTLEVELEPLVEEGHKKLMYDTFGK